MGSILADLPELAVDESGLMISPDERLPESHRHFSHAMAIYPLQTLDYQGSESAKRIIDDTISHLEKLGKGQWVGYSFAWMAALYTRQGNGGAARYHLGQFWQYMCSPNGFHLNGDYTKAGITQFHYRPFTLEGNMAAADALQEMLLQTNNGVIRPFPAIPKEWRITELNLAGFVARWVCLYLRGSQKVSSTMSSCSPRNVTASSKWRIGSIQTNSESNIRNNQLRFHCAIGSGITVPLCKGETCTISPVKHVKI